MRYINQRNYPDIPYITRTDPDNPRHEHGKVGLTMRIISACLPTVVTIWP